MKEEKKHIEFEKESKPVYKSIRGILKGVIDGTFLTRKKVLEQLPFIFFLVFLGLLYISNRYHAETLRNKIGNLREVTNELRSESIFVSSQLMKVSRQTEVADQVIRKGLDLKESVDPPKKILINPEK